MNRGRALRFPKRSEIYLVNLDPTPGSEIRKIRPAVIVQNNVANASSTLTIVAAISSKSGHILYPTEVPIQPGESGLPNPSIVLCNQIRSIDKKRILKRLGRVKPERMNDVDTALRISLGLTTLQ